MTKYQIPVTWHDSELLTVEASSLNEAVSKANSEEFIEASRRPYHNPDAYYKVDIEQMVDYGAEPWLIKEWPARPSLPNYPSSS